MKTGLLLDTIIGTVENAQKLRLVVLLDTVIGTVENAQKMKAVLYLSFLIY